MTTNENSTSRNYLPHEICRGIAIHLDPAALLHLRSVRIVTAPGSTLTRTKHYFICVGRVRAEACLVPSSSARGSERLMLRSDEKHGHRKWLRIETHVITKQFWMVDVEALCERADADWSRRGQRNTVDPRGMIRIDAALRASFPGPGFGPGGRAA
jgi:hypothetical protein